MKKTVIYTSSNSTELTFSKDFLREIDTMVKRAEKYFRTIDDNHVKISKNEVFLEFNHPDHQIIRITPMAPKPFKRFFETKGMDSATLALAVLRTAQRYGYLYEVKNLFMSDAFTMNLVNILDPIGMFFKHRVQVIDPQDDYAGLVGMVTNYLSLSSKSHESDNPTDDVVVDLDEDQRALLKLPNYRAITENYDNIDDVPIDKIYFSPDQLRIID